MASLRKNMRTLQRFNKIGASYCKSRLVKQFRTSATVFSKGESLEIFLQEDVQTILHRITGFEPSQAFLRHKVMKADRPKYKVLTDAELRKEFRKAKAIKERRLQMPPFMSCREPRDEIISENPELTPSITSKYVFIDISMDTKRINHSSARPVVCRHENGELKTADWNMFDRMSQIYCPVPGRQLFTPKMFEEDNLEKMLEAEKYLYILERACAQFEPDSSDFIRVTHRIYEHVAAHDHFNDLRSTRFFGPMSFYFAWINKIEPLLADMVNRDLLVDAIDLINLKRITLHQPIKEGDILTIFKDYCMEDSNRHHIVKLRTALDNLDQRLEDKLKRRQEVTN